MWKLILSTVYLITTFISVELRISEEDNFQDRSPRCESSFSLSFWDLPMYDSLMSLASGKADLKVPVTVVWNAANLVDLHLALALRDWEPAVSVLKRTCGQSSNINCTYFSNPEYPAPYKGNGNPCTLSVWKCNKAICQVRLDFIDFNLGEPDAMGRCTDDFLLITGTGSNIKRICGMNTGQHVYLDFAGEAPIELLIDVNSALATERKWNIKISQVECCKRAPVGCLMHYTASSGKVKSLNYAPTLSTAVQDPTAPGPGTRQLAELNYGVCVQMLPGYCSIEWTQSVGDKYSFTVSGDTEALDPTVLGTAAASVTGEMCLTNFVIIPNPTVDELPSKTDRFCGNGFPTVVSSSKPFVMTVVTNPATSPTEVPETPDVGNRGFSLNYRQLPCV
ncbi:hypothetical protein RUM43_003218 [Polyplax serrata]|uniref:CUB domain-containing protein n=1 Tax=Polyplax serrata TaxID=468196 RepID=A0AAN8P1S7_POLSC